MGFLYPEYYPSRANPEWFLFSIADLKEVLLNCRFKVRIFKCLIAELFQFPVYFH